MAKLLISLIGIDELFSRSSARPMMLHSSTQQLHYLHIQNVLLQTQSLKKKSLLKKMQNISSWKCFAVSKTQHHLTKDQNMLSVSLRFFSDIPLYESPGKASFGHYLEHKPRLAKATFPGKCRQLNQEEWRIQTPKIQMLFLQIWPTVDMKMVTKTKGEGYSFDVPHSITKILELEMTNWEINGVHRDYRPSSANVSSKGAIYSEKIGTRSRLKFQFRINLSFLVPDALSFVPKDVLRCIFEAVLKAMIEDLKHEAMDKLAEDYRQFRKEKNKTTLEHK